MPTPEQVFYVKALFDPEARVWYVADTDVPGLATEAETPDQLLAKLDTMIPELLEANGVVRRNNDILQVPFDVILANHQSGNHVQ